MGHDRTVRAGTKVTELAAEHLIAIINDGQQPLSEVLVDAELIERESVIALAGGAHKKAKKRSR